jgi:thiol-disulfide isomerase/thioredoxin
MSDLETSNSSGSDAKEKEVVYKQMQMAAGASLLVFGVGLAAFSYFYNQSNVSSYHQYSRSEDVKKWPSSAPARPQANGLTLMSFWAYWCEPCREEMPDMSKLADSVESLHIVFLNTDEPDNPNWDEAHQFADRFDNASVEYSWDNHMKLMSSFGLSMLPAHYLVTPSGQVVWHMVGQFDWADPSFKKKINLLNDLGGSQGL